MRPPTIEEKQRISREELSRIVATSRGPLTRERRIKALMAYAGRDWCVIFSGGEMVLAVRGSHIDPAGPMGAILDFEEMPPKHHPIWTQAAYQMGDRGPHFYLPPGCDYQSIKKLPGPMQRLALELEPLVDKRYCRFSYIRGYWHEHPRLSPIVIPSGAMLGEVPEWRRTLSRHQKWHEYAHWLRAQHDPNGGGKGR